MLGADNLPCCQVLNRVNVFNGRRYSQDPTILSWDILNEPRNPQLQEPPGDQSAPSFHHIRHVMLFELF